MKSSRTKLQLFTATTLMLFGGNNSIHADESFEGSFNEKDIINAMKKSSVASLESQFTALSGLEIEQSTHSAFSWNLAPSLEALASNADAANAFSPALESSYSFGVGVGKAWTAGLYTEAGFKSESSRLSSTSGVIRNTSPTYYIQAQASLYRNFMGKIDRALFNQASLARESAEIQSTMSLHQALTAVRNLYWSTMANSISINLSESLLETSKKQLNEVKRRLRSGASERADLYLSEAQVAERESSLLSLKVKEQGYLRQIRNHVPNLPHPTAADYSTLQIEPLLASVSECIAQVTSHNKAPYQYSDYAKLFPIMESVKNAELDAASMNLGPELTAGLSIESNGVDTNFSDALSEVHKFNKGTVAASLTATIPLDSKSKQTIRTKKKLAELNELKQRRELELLLSSTHTTVLKSLEHILQNMRSLGASADALKKRIQAVEQKYRQGRVDFLSLVQEQDRLFSAELGLTESRLLFLQEMFNYFAVFNKTPCDFNLEYAQIRASN